MPFREWEKKVSTGNLRNGTKSRSISPSAQEHALLLAGVEHLAATFPIGLADVRIPQLKGMILWQLVDDLGRLLLLAFGQRHPYVFKNFGNLAEQIVDVLEPIGKQRFRGFYCSEGLKKPAPVALQP